MKKILMITLLAIFAIGFTGTANAVLVNPGDTDVACTGAALPAGTLQATLVIPFINGSGLLYGTLTQHVYSNTTGILFDYQYTLGAGSKTSTQMSTGHFDEPFPIVWTTDADATTGPSTFTSNGMTRDGAGTGVAFGYLVNPIQGGGTSDLMWIQTNAPEFHLTGATSIISGSGESVELLTYDPTTTVPEPATAGLLGMGLLGFVGMLRRKFKA